MPQPQPLDDFRPGLALQQVAPHGVAEHHARQLLQHLSRHRHVAVPAQRIIPQAHRHHSQLPRATRRKAALPLAGIRLNPTATGIIALGLNGGAYAIEIIRGGVESIPKGQTEAGLALGLHPHEVFRLIILKPALRAIYPSLCSQFILLTLTTAICTSISAYELTYVGQRIEAETFRSFEVYFSLTMIYLVISFATMALLSAIGRWAFNYPQR